MSCLQERLRLTDRQNEGQLPGPAHGRQIACGIAGAEVLGDQELVQAACYCDAAGNGGSGVSALIESGDVVADLLQPDIIQSDAIIIEPGKVAVQIIGVGVDGTGRGPELGRKSIKPELGQPSISVHEILL